MAKKKEETLVLSGGLHSSGGLNSVAWWQVLAVSSEVGRTGRMTCWLVTATEGVGERRGDIMRGCECRGGRRG